VNTLPWTDSQTQGADMALARKAKQTGRISVIGRAIASVQQPWMAIADDNRDSVGNGQGCP